MIGGWSSGISKLAPAAVGVYSGPVGRTDQGIKKIKFCWNSVSHFESAAYGACHLKMFRFNFPVKRIDFFKN
jgi:hypothetical protein